MSWALKPKGGIDSHNENYHEIEGIQDQAEWHTKLGPFAGSDSQLSGRDDVGDVAGDEHTARDEQAI